MPYVYCEPGPQLEELRFFYFEGCGVESFALEQRAKTIHIRGHNAQRNKLWITTSKNRASMKHLLAKIWSTRNPESICLTYSCSCKMRSLFEPATLEYWEDIKRQK